MHTRNTFTGPHRAAQQNMRTPIWDFYADLKAYRVKPDKDRRRALRARFGRDTFPGLTKTCPKNGVSFRAYLGSRFGVTGKPPVPPLQQLDCRRAEAA